LPSKAASVAAHGTPLHPKLLPALTDARLLDPAHTVSRQQRWWRCVPAVTVTFIKKADCWHRTAVTGHQPINVNIAVIVIDFNSVHVKTPSFEVVKLLAASVSRTYFGATFRRRSDCCRSAGRTPPQKLQFCTGVTLISRAWREPAVMSLIIAARLGVRCKPATRAANLAVARKRLIHIAKRICCSPKYQRPNLWHRRCRSRTKVAGDARRCRRVLRLPRTRHGVGAGVERGAPLHNLIGD